MIKQTKKNLLGWTASTEERGVIVGSDKNQEWMLPWWYYHYHQHNTLPITFIDFGMSKKALSWCKERGEIVTFREEIPITPKEQIPKNLQKEWTNPVYPNIWKSRNAWFKKPLACLYSPYKKTIWIDLDCQVLRPLNHLFAFVEKEHSVSVTKHITCDLLNVKRWAYNSGVVVFYHGSPIIQEWAKKAIAENHLWFADDFLLTDLINQKKEKFIELPPFFNWMYFDQKNSNPDLPIHIIHYYSAAGKKIIQKQIEFHTYILQTDLTL
ncbi:MAG: hypothetical protein WCP39_00190 [Chlamydiota bacterium]